jgi:hypothetical protein
MPSNGPRKLRLRPPNLHSREPDRRSRQLDAVLGLALAPRPKTRPAAHDGEPCRPTAATTGSGC